MTKLSKVFVSNERCIYKREKIGGEVFAHREKVGNEFLARPQKEPEKLFANKRTGTEKSFGKLILKRYIYIY